MKLVLAAAAVLALAAPAAAQPGAVPLPSPPTPPPPSDSLSEDVALGLSLAGTAGSWALLSAGLALNSGTSNHGNTVILTGALATLVMPSLGHWYARRVVTRGLGLRILGAAGLFASISVAVQCDDGCPNAGLSAVFLTGLALFIGGTIDDIATAPRAARRYNEQRSLRLVPLVNRDTGTVGLGLGGRF